MKVGLFFGSFSPPHIVHTLIAINAKEEAVLDEVWFVVSPQNPFKDKNGIAPAKDRLNMVRILTQEMGDGFKASEVEFALPQPSYTADTLAVLKIVPEYKDYDFHIILGRDSSDAIFNWKNCDYILNNFKILVYDRIYNDEKGDCLIARPKLREYSNITKLTGPIIDMSSTYIRDRIKTGKKIKFLVCDSVVNYINDNKVYS